MKKFGDVVQYVHNVREMVANQQGHMAHATTSKTSNALVIASSVHEGREQLQIVYLDQAENGGLPQNAVKTVFTFPFTESKYQHKENADPKARKSPPPPPPQGWMEAQ